MVTFLFGVALLFCLVWALRKWGVGFEHFLAHRGSALAPNVMQAIENKRRTERLSLVVPIHVTGQDVKGEAFEEETQTKELSGYGALIVLSRQLRAGNCN